MYSKLIRVSHHFTYIYIWDLLSRIPEKQDRSNFTSHLITSIALWATKRVWPLRSMTTQRLQETTQTLLFPMVPPAIAGFFWVCIVSLFSQECFFQQRHLQHIEYWSILPSILLSSSWIVGVAEMQRSPRTCPRPHNESVAQLFLKKKRIVFLSLCFNNFFARHPLYSLDYFSFLEGMGLHG